MRLSVYAFKVGKTAKFLWYFDLSSSRGSGLDKLWIHLFLCLFFGVLFNLAEWFLLTATLLHHLLEILLEDLFLTLHVLLHSFVPLIHRVQLQNHLEYSFVSVLLTLIDLIGFLGLV